MTTEEYMDWITDPEAQAQARRFREEDERRDWLHRMAIADWLDRDQEQARPWDDERSAL